MVIPPMYGDDWGWFMIVLPTLSTARKPQKTVRGFSSLIAAGYRPFLRCFP